MANVYEETMNPGGPGPVLLVLVIGLALGVFQLGQKVRHKYHFLPPDHVACEWCEKPATPYVDVGPETPERNKHVMP